MAYVFAAEEQGQIQVVYDAANAGEVPWWALYEKVSLLLGAALERGAVAVSDIKDTEAAMLWFDGAVQVNKGEGAFSDFIRAYTAKQFELRLGISSMETVIGQMQAVSDAIAKQVVKIDILDGGGVLPTMQSLADSDASIAGQMLYSSLGDNDSAFASNSGWSGAVLFSMFGTDESDRLLAGGVIDSLDTVEDLRDVLFAIESFGAAAEAARDGESWDELWGDGSIGLRALEARGQSAVPYILAVLQSAVNPNWWQPVIREILKGEKAEGVMLAVFAHGGVNEVLSAGGCRS